VTTASVVSRRHDEWFTVTEHLISELESLAPGRVIACVALCRRRLAAEGLRGEGLLYATESMARTMLAPQG
jgi:hypothetical protein